MVANVPKMPSRKYRRDTSEVSACLKYMIFGFNVLFWVRFLYNIHVRDMFLFLQLLGLGILTVGVWAWSEKDTFNNLSKVANVALDPAFILICIGKKYITVLTKLYHTEYNFRNCNFCDWFYRMCRCFT